MNLAASGAPSPDRLTLAVIPARLDATRLPRKPLRLLAGLPLVVRVWQHVQRMGVAARCVVATDSRDVADAVTAAGIECVMTSPDHPSGTDRVAEVAAMKAFAAFRTILNVQGDEPFVSDAAVRGAAGMVAEGRFPLGTAAAPAAPAILDSPHVVKVVTADDGRAMYFSRAAIPHLRDPADRSARDAALRQHIGVYAYHRDALAAWVRLPPHPLEQIERLEQLRPLAAGLAMGVALVDSMEGEGSWSGGIDTEDDLIRANTAWETFSAGRS